MVGVTQVTAGQLQIEWGDRYSAAMTTIDQDRQSGADRSVDPPHESHRVADDASLISARFVIIIIAGFCYFVSFTMLLPTLPRYIVNELDGNEFQVGLVMGAFGIAAAVFRPFVGRLGDRFGRRPLLMIGAAISGLAIWFYPVFLSIPALMLFRALNGVGETGAFVGAATAVQDYAPAHRRGEAASYFSTAVYLAMGLGPFIGELLADRGGFDLVCRAGALTSLVAVLLSMAIPADLGKAAADAPRSKGLLHHAAIKPGVLMALSLLGFMAFSSFIALYLDDLDGNGDTGPVFLLYAGVVLVVRVGFRKLADTWGSRKTGSLSTLLTASGLAIMAIVGSLIGVYVGTAVMAVGIALGYPAFFLLVMADTADDERSHAVASFSFFFDLPGAFAAPILGVVISAAGSPRAGFAVGSVFALVAFVGLRRLTSPLPDRDDVIDAFAAG